MKEILLPPQGGNLRIGGIDIVISAPCSSRLRISNPLYRPFLDSGAGTTYGPRMSVRVRSDSWPPWRDIEKVFDTRDSWSAYRDNKNFFIRLAAPRGENPLWIARFNPGVGRVALYCPAGPIDKNGKHVTSLPLVYPLDQLLLMYYFSGRKGLLAHAAGLVLDSRAFLFAGASGAGKSTISELLVRAKLGRVLSDERMIVREIKGQMVAFGTPWAGTAGIARAGCAPLAGIFFLKHGKNNLIEKLDAAAAADLLLPMASVPWYDPDTAAPIIAFSKGLMARVPAYEMRFTPDRSAIDFFRDFLEKYTDRSL